MVNPAAFTRIMQISRKKSSLLKSKAPYFDFKRLDLTFQNTLLLKMGACPFVIRCLLICYPMPSRFLWVVV